MITMKPARFHYRLGANQPAASPTVRRLAEMEEAILRDSDGAFRLEVFPQSRLGPDPQMFADLQKGALEFYMSGALLGGVAPTSALPLLPFAFKDSKAVFAALDGALGDIIRGELAAGGLYDALQAKKFDGQSDPLGVVQSLRLYEVQSHLSLTAHWWTGFTLIANAASWQKLPAEIQAVVARNAETFALLQRADIEAVNAAGAEALAGHGMIINTADTTSIRARLGDFNMRWRARFNPAAWKLLEAA